MDLRLIEHEIEVASDEVIVVTQICTSKSERPVVFIHGAVENGRIFYTDSGKGLAPFLARQGFNCYVVDLRGRGKSYPSIDGSATVSQTDIIKYDLPKISAWLRFRHPKQKQSWISHSWGGVLINSFLLRHDSYCRQVESIVHFGAKRQVKAKTWERYWKISLVWNRLCFLITAIYGYLPGKKFGLGSDSESRLTHTQSVAWVKSKTWTDIDGFDYARKASIHALPRTLYVMAKGDRALGHPDDCQRFAAESGIHQHHFVCLEKKSQSHEQYGHVDMLTHPKAERDVYPLARAFLYRE